MAAAPVAPVTALITIAPNASTTAPTAGPVAPMTDAMADATVPKANTATMGTVDQKTVGTGIAAVPAAAVPAAMTTVLSPLAVQSDQTGALPHSVHLLQGYRSKMEDMAACHTLLELKEGKLKGVTSPVSFFGVFDGHGGATAAEYTKHHLVRNVVAALEAGVEPDAALVAAFEKTDRDFLASSDPSDTSGTCAIVLLVEQSTKRYWCANVGDSRAVLCQKKAALPLSRDHKPDRPDELDRIRKAGGFVIHKRVMGELAVSRAIGDRDLKTSEFPLVLATPEVQAGTFDTSKDGADDFVVLGCDGLYDVMSNDQVVSFVMQSSQTTQSTQQSGAAAVPGAEAVAAVTRPFDVEIAAKLTTHAVDELHTRDNTSAIVIQLRSA